DPVGGAGSFRGGRAVAVAPAHRPACAAGALPAPRTPTPPSAPGSADLPGTNPAAVRPAGASAGAPPAPPALAPTPPRSTATAEPPPAAGSSATPALPRTRCGAARGASRRKVDSCPWPARPLGLAPRRWPPAGAGRRTARPPPPPPRPRQNAPGTSSSPFGGIRYSAPADLALPDETFLRRPHRRGPVASGRPPPVVAPGCRPRAPGRTSGRAAGRALAAPPPRPAPAPIAPAAGHSLHRVSASCDTTGPGSPPPSAAGSRPRHRRYPVHPAGAG